MATVMEFPEGYRLVCDRGKFDPEDGLPVALRLKASHRATDLNYRRIVDEAHGVWIAIREFGASIARGARCQP